jgi:DNA-directed RNA polymerase specialized sigma24 family protein
MVLTDSNDPRFSFETVVLPHLDGAHNLAMWLVQNPSFAQDIVQDAIVRALTFLSRRRWSRLVSAHRPQYGNDVTRGADEAECHFPG